MDDRYVAEKWLEMTAPYTLPVIIWVSAARRDSCEESPLTGESLAKDLALKKKEGHTVMYTAVESESSKWKWKPFGLPRQSRSLSSMVLEEGVALSTNSGILIEGSRTEGAICCMDRQGKAASYPMAYRGIDRLTFSGLLNALDGVASFEGRIFCMTTNFIERLDPALIRPGRVDLKQYVGHCTHWQLTQMFQRFYGATELAAEGERFAKRALAADPDLNAAQVQGHFMLYKMDPTGVIDNVAKIKESEFYQSFI